MTKLAQLQLQRQIAFNRLLETKEIAEKAISDPTFRTLLFMRHKFNQTYLDEFMSIHIQILNSLATTKDFDAEAEDIIRKNADNAFFFSTSTVDSLSPSEMDQAIGDPKLSAHVHNPIKLPKLSLQTFNGDFKSWATFRDMFEISIHQNASLSNIEKFQYLIASLSKTPLSIVTNLPITNENYSIAYKSLLDRYQNKRLLATHYWREIQNLSVVSSDSPIALRNLLDCFSENLAALKLMEFPVSEWDFILFNLLLDKLDIDTRKSFEKEHSTVDLPTFENLKTYVSNLCNALSRVEKPTQKNPHYGKSVIEKSFSSKPKSALIVNTVENSNRTNSCPCCKANHFLYQCPTFTQKAPYDRYLFVKDNSLCLNCIRGSHSVKNCPSVITCKICNYQHHTLLHFRSNAKEPLHSPVTVSPSEPTPGSSQTVLTSTIPNQLTVLLSTAQVEIVDAWGNPQVIRAVLDSASQASFITEKCVQKFRLARKKSFVPIQGLAQFSSTACSGTTHCSIRAPGHSEPSFPVDFVILDKICNDMPNAHIDSSKWEHIENLRLADPHFGTPNKIDILLGADIFPLLLKNGRITGNSNQPIALNTVFGWILMGPVSFKLPSRLTSLFVASNSSLDLTLKKFWELEEVPGNPSASPEETLCENIYRNTHTKNNSGRYIVSLPFKGPEPIFRNSHSLALRRFRALEHRLLQNSSLHEMYSAFMQDYLDSGHMELLVNPSVHDKTYYIPHHCVLKPDSTSTKLRVVFDASAKPPHETSLNDHLLIGAKLQRDIVTILLHFRLHSIVFTADIKQMYRQILVDSSHRDYQRILWRFSSDKPIQEYRLKTVTYGVSSAPFLAIRTIHQLAMDEIDNYPLASRVLQSDVYVDDVVSGSDSLEHALDLQQQLNEILKKGGFELRKWASNHPSMLAPLPDNYIQVPLSLDSDSNVAIKILGLQWLPAQDVFSYKVDILNSSCTKRTILSELAKTFDPLGFLSPLTFFAKHLIQHLWYLGLDWDETPPSDICDMWAQYKSQLPEIAHLQIPRRVCVDQFSSCQLHGFCDASELGYAAVIYIRFVSSDVVTTYFICAKSKVAPLKRISVPRLELCAAYLLSNLMSFVISSYSDRLIFDKIFAWSDSSVVLSWLNSSPHRWKTFVSNRVTHIQERVAPLSWHHVRSSDNPADCASRGLLPSALRNHPLWWTGPLWLSSPENAWPTSDLNTPSSDLSSSVLREERKLVLATVLSCDIFDPLLIRYSSLPKLQRLVAYWYRYMHNLRHPLEKLTGPFSANDLHKALLELVKRAQHLVFQDDIRKLETKQACSKPLRKLNPFLDEGGLVRVGGRLSHSSLSYDQKHPILLPRNHRLTELIIVDTHCKNLHPGLKALQFLLLQNFWILSAKRAIQHCLSNCYRCFRTKPRPLEPFMGNLPSVRINQVKPFSCVGVDYGGPFTITLGKIRGAKTHKAYICLFVCLTTKALHLELASDLSTEAFLASLRRFVARRGRCSKIFSDCGTNFVGAQRQLHQCMQQSAEAERIEWHFNPPSAPHFGGIWEAGIKSVKTHLYRVIGTQILTYEELNTVLIQIEAVLNSRPLCEVSSDPNDYSVLTPGHFLTLEPLTVIPDQNLLDTNINRLTRWQLLQRLHQDFWSRWHREYLHTLQQRPKWNKTVPPLAQGTLVLIVDDSAPPLHWRLGRVERLHSGRDGVCRVVTLKTKQGTIQRPVVKVCPLPASS